MCIKHIWRIRGKALKNPDGSEEPTFYPELLLLQMVWEAHFETLTKKKGKKKKTEKGKCQKCLVCTESSHVAES